MARKGEQFTEDIEKGYQHHSSSDGSDDGSLCFSDAEDHSWHSPNCADTTYDCRVSAASSRNENDEFMGQHRRSSDLESEVDLEIKVEEGKVERNCRICHLSLEKAAAEPGIPIVLGCSCKDDLAVAHKQCAETWFKIRGNKTCEICGSTARNVVVPGETEVIEQWNEANTSTIPPARQTETRRFWQGHRFLNFLLACLVLAFVISWLFHFNVPG